MLDATEGSLTHIQNHHKNAISNSPFFPHLVLFRWIPEAVPVLNILALIFANNDTRIT